LRQSPKVALGSGVKRQAAPGRLPDPDRAVERSCGQQLPVGAVCDLAQQLGKIPEGPDNVVGLQIPNANAGAAFAGSRDCQVGKTRAWGTDTVDWPKLVAGNTGRLVTGFRAL